VVICGWLAATGRGVSSRSLGWRGRLQVLVADCAMLFETLLKAAQLLFHFFDRAIERGKDGPGLLDRYKFVVMLGADAKLQRGPLAVLEIHGHGNGGHAIKIFAEQVNFFGDFFLRGWAEVSMPGGNRRLHRCISTVDSTNDK
jgi:hypothetical protein